MHLKFQKIIHKDEIFSFWKHQWLINYQHSDGIFVTINNQGIVVDTMLLTRCSAELFVISHINNLTPVKVKANDWYKYN